MPSDPLITLLRTPQFVTNLVEADWNEVVEHGRKAHLLGSLAACLRRACVLEQVPPAVQRHLVLAELTAHRRSEAALWEVGALRRAVNPAIALVLLKGCAYAVCEDANAAGRTFSDVDVMVRRKNLDALESSLVSAGWKPSEVNGYDQAYYRNWMHEVPPMEHVRRRTVVDLHHAINPPISRYYVDPQKLFEHLVEVQPGVFSLGVHDRVIHCALHLLQEGEPKKLLRDLFDLHLLAQQHANTPDSLRQLQDRAKDLGVLKLVQSAMGASQSLFACNRSTVQSTGWLVACVVYAARQANLPSSWFAGLASTIVLAHSHRMKMPLNLLLPHLIRKAWVNQFPRKS